MIEVHPDPASALTDGPQAVPCDELPALAARLRAVARAVRTEALAS
jgi:3-deoxy-D-arabino-heptulosonate 7-phosphate (DAHP) synthase